SDAMVDTSAPAVPALTLSESSPSSFVSGTTLYYNPTAAGAGFTVDAATSDAQSGVQKVNFPAIAGITGGGDATTSPYQGSYSWATGASASGDADVTVTNKAGLTSTASLTLTPDSTAPSSQSAAISGGPWYTSLSVPLTLAGGSDAGAGIDGASGI